MGSDGLNRLPPDWRRCFQRWGANKTQLEDQACLRLADSLCDLAMDWYYAGDDNQPVGPVSEAQFEQLVRAGRVQPDTLVWQHGMSEWCPLRATRGASPTAQPLAQVVPGNTATVADTAVCAECRQTYRSGEMIQLGGSWVCARCKPVFLQRIIEGAPQPLSESVWRDGQSLVMASGAELPCRCARCNSPVTRPPIKRTLYWHQQWIYLLIVLSLLIYVIVALIVRKKAVARIPLCDQHRQKRWMIIAASWLMALVGIGTFAAGVGAQTGGGAALLAGLVLFITGIVLGIWKGRLVVAKKIDSGKVWISGFCRQYLDGLPEWRGGPRMP